MGRDAQISSKYVCFIWKFNCSITIIKSYLFEMGRDAQIRSKYVCFISKHNCSILSLWVCKYSTYCFQPGWIFVRPIHPLDGLLFETRPCVSGWRLSLEVEGFSWVAIQLGVQLGGNGDSSSWSLSSPCHRSLFPRGARNHLGQCDQHGWVEFSKRRWHKISPSGTQVGSWEINLSVVSRKALPELETEHIVDSMRIFNGRRPRVQRVRPHRMYNWGQAHMLRSTKIHGLMELSFAGPREVAGIVRARNINNCVFHFFPQTS